MLIGVALLAGCVRSCGCGGKQAADGDESAMQAGTAAAAPAEAAEAAAGANASSRGASGPGTTRDAQQFTPAPDSKLTRQLIAARTEIDKGHVFDKLVAPAAIAALLPDKLGEFHARNAASSAVREGSGSEVAVAARNYSAGKRGLRVKITDTALLPVARRAVSERLAEIGNAAAGNQRGLFVRGYPAVAAGFEADHASRATALIANRYLVEVMVRDPADPDDALHVIEQLDWGKLALKQAGTPAPKP